MVHHPQQAPPTPSPTEAGLTLLECIVAIVVIGIMGLSVGPALVLTAATRVQSQRADQAIALAQREIDRSRLLMERGDFVVSDLPFVVPTTDIRAVAAPVAFVPSTSYTNGATQARFIDLDGDGANDFAIQVFRNAGVTPPGASTPISFQIGVRVYDITAQASLGSLRNTQASIGLTSREGSRRTAPLITLYTTILRGDASNSLCIYASSLANGSSTGLSCD